MRISCHAAGPIVVHSGAQYLVTRVNGDQYLSDPAINCVTASLALSFDVLLVRISFQPQNGPLWDTLSSALTTMTTFVNIWALIPIKNRILVLLTYHMSASRFAAPNDTGFKSLTLANDL